MKVGDLVNQRPSAYDGRPPCGHGIMIDSYENEDGVLYYEVQWFDDDRMWYDELELKVISESR